MSDKATAAGRPRIDGDRYVPALLSVLNNRLSSGASQLYLRHFGVGINEWRILSVLSNTPGSNTVHICETVSMHKTVASRSLREMEAKGLLRIERHGGQRLMALTRDGQALHDRIALIALGREALLVGGFSASEREKLLVRDFSAAERATLLGFFRRMRANVPAVDAWDPIEAPPARRRRGG